VALIGFNLGVEAGQLAVLGLAFAVLGWFRERRWYRNAVTRPLSLISAAIGAWWAIERLFGG